jgi:hypothetical protein
LQYLSAARPAAIAISSDLWLNKAGNHLQEFMIFPLLDAKTRFDKDYIVTFTERI